MEWTEKAIIALGRDVTAQQQNGNSGGAAVIYPARIRTASGDRGSFTEAGMAEQQLYYMLCPVSFSGGLSRGDTVTDQDTEYYVLWTEDVCTAQGSYGRVCMRKITRENEGENEWILSGD